MYSKIVFLIAVVVLAGAVSAASPWHINKLDADVTFSGEIEIPQGDLSKLDWIEGAFYIAPLDTPLQSSEIISAYPSTYALETDIYGNTYVKFRWEHPTSRTLKYSISWNVKTDRLKYAMTSPGYPGDNLSSTLGIYTEYDNLTQWTGFMNQKAQSITAGSNSTLESVRRLSSWISSMVTYDISCWQGSFPAEKVFYERRGVCDEFTNLFISFARSLGIPSRYVEGLVYSGEDWNYHAWAEVYIDGWVSVDVTYNEVGFQDSSHIVLAKVQSDSEIYSSLKWASNGVSANFANDNFDVKVNDEKMLSLLQVRTDVPASAVSSQIMNVTLDIRNLANSYVVATCSVNMPPEMLLLDSKEKSILLSPNGEDELRWKIGTPSDLDAKYTYMMPIQMMCFPGINQTKELIVDSKESVPKTASATLLDLTALNSSKVIVTVLNDGTAELNDVVVMLCIGTGASQNCVNQTIDTFDPSDRDELLFTGLNITEGTKLSATIADMKSSIQTEITKIEEPTPPDAAETAARELLKQSGKEADNQFLILVILIIAIVLIIIAIIVSFARRD